MSTQELGGGARPSLDQRASGLGGQLAAGARAVLERASGVLVWLGFVVVFALWIPDTFLTTATAQSIAGDQAITLILALGVLFTLAGGQFDLSAAQILGLSAVVSTSLMANADMAPLLAVILTLGAGLLVGAANGLMVVFGVSSFIATLASSSVLVALTSIVSQETYAGPVPESFQSIATAQPLGIPIVAIYAIAVAIVAWYVLEHTPVGRKVQATGANAEAARLAGVRTRLCVFATFLVSGLLASAAGILVAAKIGSVSPDLGPPYLLPAFAACFLGATQIKPDRFNVWGTVLAVYLLATGVKGLQLAGGKPWITDMFNGVALAGAVIIAVAVQKRRDARLRAASDRAAIDQEPAAAGPADLAPGRTGK